MAVQTLLSVNSNGFTACFFSLVSARVVSLIHGRRGVSSYRISPSPLEFTAPIGTPPTTPSHPEPSASLINPSGLLVELGTHMCCCMAHKLNARLKRKNPNRKREKENKNERVGKRTAVNHVLKSPAAGGRESA